MRDYTKISPQFWTGDTGKKIKKLGVEVQVLALYLISSPHANMYGIYYLPVSFICYETGLSEEGALKGLQRLSEGGFCLYDPQKEYVWVIEMARFQVSEQLKVGDNNIKAINKFYESLPNLLFLEDFFERYQTNFHLKNRRKNRENNKAPSKPLRSQEQEQEQEQDINKETLANANVKKKKKTPDCPYDEIFDLYECILVEEPKTDPKFMRPIAVHINSRNDERKRLLLKRWQESPLFQDLQFWEAFFWVVRDTSLYNGSITNNEYKTPFKPDIEWVLKTKFNRIVDKLPRDDSPPNNQEATQENLNLTQEEEI